MIQVDFNNISTIRYSSATSLVENKQWKTAFKKHKILPELDYDFYINLKKAFINITLDELQSISNKYKRDYGELVICVDYDKANYWRKQLYTKYKANRDNRVSNEYDTLLGKYNFEHKSEFLDYFRKAGIKVIDKVSCLYKNNENASVEADDIIAVLSTIPGKHLIVSNDGDYHQLMVNSNVKIYNPIERKFVSKTRKEIDEKNLLSCLNGQSKDNIMPITYDTQISQDFIKWMQEKHNIEITDKIILTLIRDYSKYMKDYEYEKAQEDIQLIKDGKRKLKRNLRAFEKPNFSEAKALKWLQEYGSLEDILKLNILYKARYELNNTLYNLHLIPVEIKEAIISKYNEPIEDRDDYQVQLYSMQNGIKDFKL